MTGVAAFIGPDRYAEGVAIGFGCVVVVVVVCLNFFGIFFLAGNSNI